MPTWPLAEIARRVGLSTTPCWRRINRLQEAGIIRARVALLERKAVNAGVTVFVAVRTAQHNAQWLAASPRRWPRSPRSWTATA